MTRKILFLFLLFILLDVSLSANFHQALSQTESAEPTVQIQLTSEEKDSGWLSTKISASVWTLSGRPFVER
jgi:hypothetical protein